MLLELRFETLWDYVDYFVISEASYAHTGLSREPQFDIKKFSKYASKIRYLRLDSRPSGPNDFWKNENYIRNNLSNGLFDASDNDLIIISDLDEIPNPIMLHTYDSKFLRGDFDQRYYSYFLNNYWIGDVNQKGILRPQSNIWRGSKITTYKHFIHFFGGNATSVRSYKSHGLLRSLKREWFKRFNVQLIPDGGWHFTWIFKMEDIIKKIENTAHQEFNSSEYKNAKHIEKMIRAGRDFHKPLARYEKRALDHTFPLFLQKNIQRYSEWLL